MPLRFLSILLAALCACAFIGPARAHNASLEEMLGQMVMVGFRGLGQPDQEEGVRLLLEDIAAGRVGGVILFERDAQTRETRNIVSVEQAAHLAALLQQQAPRPLFIAVDQEGGRVRRFRSVHGVAPTPSAETMGKEAAASTRRHAKVLGQSLARAGVNLNFAPSVDVNSNPASPVIGALGRSFSSDPAIVAAHGNAFARGLRDSGVIPVFKHFPGHGSATADSHVGPADITATWTPEELAPYRMLLPEHGAAMVMIGHMVHEVMDGELPASLSEKVVNGLLRERLGWQGVVVTDDLQMRAISDAFSPKEALLRAVEAGVDILLVGNNLRHDPLAGRVTHALLVELVEEGVVSPERILESYQRIRALKEQLPGRGQSSGGLGQAGVQ